MTDNHDIRNSIAIVGMAGRFPSAPTLDAFWRHLREGRELITFFSEEELEVAPPTPAAARPSYVRARAMLEGASLFDPAFFGFTPKEAEIIDPQHRLFLECAWQAMEDAAIDPERFAGTVGVFGGMSMNSYLANIQSHPELAQQIGSYLLMLGNDKDFLPTRVSYKLNLKGPSVNVQTACSTSLVAVCFACESLLNYECDAALAGAVSVVFPQKEGYVYREGGILSPDGHCRSFDEKAAGTVPGEGVGIVVLKRLEDALESGDSIRAVIRGFGINNDGARKIGYTAPSVNGQAEAIAAAHAMAGVDPRTIQYVEAHGTATPIGDPIEIAALTQAFRLKTPDVGFCAIGSVKSNIGHLDVAAGMAGLIKAVLAIEHGEIPPSLHFQQSNPKMDLERSPFRVQDRLAPWPCGAAPRRAGVSSFGIGGTNTHVVLEQAPAVTAPASSRTSHLLVLSAKTPSALDRAAANLRSHLLEHPDAELEDVAYTLQVGRRHFAHRRTLVATNTADAARALDPLHPERMLTGLCSDKPASVAFLFPGQGAQEINMGRQLYREEQMFRECVDECCEHLLPRLGVDLRTILYPAESAIAEAESKITETQFAQPALFIVEYALAKLWMQWGVRPSAMIGHSLGEYAAACISGALQLPDALDLVALRAEWMQRQARGGMVAVRLPEEEVAPLLPPGVTIAAVNGRSLCVAAGPLPAIEAFEEELRRRSLAGIRLRTSHAFHSAMMEPAMAPLSAAVRKLRPHLPHIPYLSNLTGDWIREEDACDPDYWAKHLRNPVRFHEGMTKLLEREEVVLLEVGPGKTLVTMARQHPLRREQHVPVASLAAANGWPEALGQLWIAGIPLDWDAVNAGGRRRRAPLPTYPFERITCWVERAHSGDAKRLEDLPCTAISSEAQATSPAVAPTGETAPEIQSTLAALLSGISGIPEDVLKRGSFLELGMDSLFLTQVSAELEKQFGVRIPFRQLAGPLGRLELLAAHVESLKPRDEERLETAEAAAESEAPLTPAQNELWDASQRGEDMRCSFNEAFVLHLRGSLNIEALRTAVNRICARHAALRLTISPNGESQRVHPPSGMEVPLIDLSTVDEAERLRELDAVYTREADMPFDLSMGPLIRFHLIRLAGEHHVLLVTYHHIISDGSSLHTLTSELGRLYTAACAGESCELPPPLQFDAYARHEAVILSGPRHEEDQAYWAEKLSPAPLPIILPFEPGEKRTSRGLREGIAVPESLARSLREFSAERGCTPFTALLAAYSQLLNRLSGQTDLPIGIPVARRTQPGAVKMIGHCVNFLPLRIPVHPAHSFSEHLEAVKEILFDASEHSTCTIGTILSKLSAREEGAQGFQVTTSFNMNRLPDTLEYVGLAAELLPCPHSGTNFDLSFSVVEHVGRLRVECRYREGAFSAASIRSWLNCYVRLLQEALESPDKSSVHLQMVDEEEWKRLSVGRCQTSPAVPAANGVHELVETQAETQPDTVAVVWGDRSLTYAALNARANRIAHHLRRLISDPDVPITLCARPSGDLLAAMLGVLKAGAACMLLDPTLPSDVLRSRVESALTPLVIADAAVAGRLPLSSARLIRLDSAFSGPEANPETRAGAANAAFILHTSGSSSAARAVVISHGAALGMTAWHLEHTRLSAPARTAQSAPLSSVAALQEMLVTLCTAGTLVAPSTEDAASPAGLLRFLHDQGITRIFLSPAALQQLADEAEQSSSGPLPLRDIVCSGEQLRITPSVTRLFNAMPGCALHNQYASAECLVAAAFTCEAPVAASERIAPLGAPAPNAQVYILDAHLNPAPVGVPGEIYVGGEGLAEGYLHRPDLTAAALINDPFAGDPKRRLYKTGDIGRYRPDGMLEYIGRASDQREIAGLPVHPGIVDLVLAKNPAVAASVTMFDSQDGPARLTTYVRAEQQSLDLKQIRDFLRSRLPEPMTPTAFHRVSVWPVDGLGRIDCGRLASEAAAGSGEEEAYAAPGTPAEEALALIWSELFHRDKISRNDDFFALGGHSLLIARMTTRVKNTFGIDLPLRAVFTAPTLSAMALEIETLVIDDIDALTASESEPRSPSSEEESAADR